MIGGGVSKNILRPVDLTVNFTVLFSSVAFSLLEI